MIDRPTPETDILYDRMLAENPGNLIYLEEMLHHARILERERDEAIRQRNETNESSVFSCNFYYEEKLKAERERDQLKQLLAANSERVDAYLGVCIERDEARSVLQEIEAARWHTACELRRIATRALADLTIPTK